MKRSFPYLLGLTMLTILAVLILAREEPSTQGSGSGDLLLPQMAEKINQVDQVEIIAAGNAKIATLQKTAGSWQLVEMDGYQADWPKIHALLSGLARARVVEVKTDKPEYYARLGVEDVTSESSDSVLVRLSAGNQDAAVLVGHSAKGREGQYVRLQDSTSSAMIDQALDVATEQLEWANKRIIDINASEVAEVELIHPQEGHVLVTRLSANQTDFDLVDLPQDREIKSSWAVNSLGSVLSMLDLEAVRKAALVDWSNAVRMRLLMFSGIEIIVDMVKQDELHMLRLRASHPATNVTAPERTDEIEVQAAEDVAKRVAEINRRVGGWAYSIASYKYDAMVKKPEDLLKPVESLE